MAALKCTITDVKRVSKFNFEYIVGVQFEEGEKKWLKAFKVDLGHIPTMDEFKEALRHADPTEGASQGLLEDEIGTVFEMEFVPKREN